MRTSLYFVFLLLLSGILIQPSCSLSSSKCGPRMDAFEMGTIMDVWTDLGVSGGERIYRISKKVSHVCPHEHVKASFGFSFTDDVSELTVPISMEGWIEHNILFEKDNVFLVSDLSTVTHSYYDGKVESGLSQAFGDSEAIYWVVMQMTFPTLNSENPEFDLNYANEIIDQWEMTSTYFEFSD